MKKYFFYWLALCAIIAVGCQKELSFEGPNNPAEGSLQADVSGDCLPKTVNGVYEATKPLVADSNTITVDVNVVTTGTYLITTDTVNGYFFSAAGIFTTPGINTVKLRGNGTPFAAGVNNFVVTFDSTVCDVQVTVVQQGVGNLAGAPNACASTIVNGIYSPGVPLSASNNVAVQVNVTTPGNFNITTDTIDGIWFSYSGIISSSQTVLLQANGSIPASTTIGNKTFTVRLGNSSCSFILSIVGPATGTVNCAGAVFSGNYFAQQAMASSNTVVISATVATAGGYFITTDTVNGVWFSGSGNFSVTPSPTQLTLIAHGTPTSSGPFVYTVKWGTSTCTFTQTFSPALSLDYFPRTAGSNWSYEYDDNVNDSLLVNAISPTITALGNVFNIFMETDGTSPVPDSSGYYRKNGGEYYQWVNLEDYGATSANWIEFIMLKDNVPLSTNWKTPQNGITINLGVPTKIRFSNTILQKDVIVSLNTSTSPVPVDYYNVIVVEQRVEAEVLGTWQDISSTIGIAKSFYARGIGLIKVEFTSPGGGSIQELRRFNVL